MNQKCKDNYLKGLKPLHFVIISIQLRKNHIVKIISVEPVTHEVKCFTVQKLESYKLEWRKITLTVFINPCPLFLHRIFFVYNPTDAFYLLL